MTYKGYATPAKAGGRFGVCLDPADRPVTDKIISKALEKGIRLSVTIQTEGRKRSTGQLGLYWRLITMLYEAVSGERPTEEEKLAFHEDFKEQFSLRRPSRYNPAVLVPIGMSDGDTQDASHLIETAFQELAAHTLTESAQGSARAAWFEYWEAGGPKYRDESDFRAKAVLCAACGRGGLIELAHMESRGANPDRIDDPENWLPLCHEHHAEQHQHGVPAFLKQFPHLRNRWESSRRKP